MAKNLRILYESMHNKLIIATLALALVFTSSAQRSIDDSGFGATQENKIQIYPNPVVNDLFIQISNPTLKNVEIELHSIIGNQLTIRVQDLGNGRYKIPVDGFSTGYYFLIVIDEDARFKRAYKFLKS